MGTLIREQAWQPGKPRLVVPVSAVVTPESTEQTQSKLSRHLGRRLLLAAACHDNSWSEAHLRQELFDTRASDSGLHLTPENFNEVAYASSRMLHAWDVSAWIDHHPYIDASYTCSCPALELAAMGYDEIIAISPESGPFYHDVFGTHEVPPVWHDTPIHRIQPEIDLEECDVNYTQATEDGMFIAYCMGEENGLRFLSEWRT